MGTKYPGINISGYNQSPPSDNGSVVPANALKWSNTKNKIGDPLKTLAEAINTALVTVADVGPDAKSSTYTTVAGDHQKVIEVTGTNTIDLGDATSMTAGYTVTVKNNGTGVVTVGRDTSADTIDQSAADVTISKNNSRAFMVNSTADGYMSIGAGPLTGISDDSAVTVIIINNDGSTEWGAFSSSGATDGKKISPGGSIVDSSQDTTAAVPHYRFFNPNNEVGSITTNSSATAFNTSSDYRLKMQDQTLANAIVRLKTLRPINFRFKAAPNEIIDGFLAHEVQAVIPGSVVGSKDATKNERYVKTPAVYDNHGLEVKAAIMADRTVPDYQGIDHSKIVPLLTAALQEAIGKIDALEARLLAAGL